MKSIVGLAHVEVSYVRVDLRRRNIAVSQQRLHRARISAMLQKVRGKAVPQRMRRNVGHSGCRRVLLDYRPRILARQRSPSMKKQSRPGFAAELLADF